MAVTTSYTLPTIVDQEVKGTRPWIGQENVKADDSSYASGMTMSENDDFILRNASLVIDNEIDTANNEAADEVLGFGFSQLYGGASDLWGATLTPEIINSPNFGFAIAVGRKEDFTLIKTDRSYYIKATGFGFNIPADATIDGIAVRIKGDKFPLGGGSQDIYLGSMELRVTYTWSPTVSAHGYGSGFVYSVNATERLPKNKRFRYIVSEKNSGYIGEWKRVSSQPSFKWDINNLHSSMAVTLKQNERSESTAVEDLMYEEVGSSENLITEASEILQVDLAAQIGIGPGTDTDVNNEVDVIAYYGQLVELLTEDDEVMVTEDQELIVVQDGAPDGSPIFSGYIPEWELDFGGGEDTAIQLLTHSQELNNIMLETADTAKVTNPVSSNPDSSIGIRGYGEYYNTELAQTFQMSGSVPVARIRLRAKQSAEWLSSKVKDIPVTLTLTNGTTPGTPGTTLGSAVAVVQARPDDPDTWQDLDFYFDPSSLVNGTTYEFFVSIPEEFESAPDHAYPVYFQLGTTYANGALYTLNGKSSPAWNLAGADLLFTVYQPGGATEVTFNSQDPSNILKQLVDFGRTRGARINYTPETIEPTYTIVSVTFKTNTLAEAILAVIKLCPADWYEYYDFGSNLMHLHPRPETPSKMYTLGLDIGKLKIKRSILRLVNDVYFSGGNTPALFIRKTDQGSINTYRRGLLKASDNRVTVQSSAEILAQSEIDKGNTPVYSGKLTIVQPEDNINDYQFIEDNSPGELIGFSGLGEILDLIAMQAMSLTYNVNSMDIDLNVLVPKTPQRIQDIKRNLEALEQANNPSSPTVT